MGWDHKNNAHCDTCDAVKEVNGDLDFLRACGWHHSKGKTVGGKDYEAILCGSCAHDERKKVRVTIAGMSGQLDIFGEEHDGTATPKPRRSSRRFTGD